MYTWWSTARRHARWWAGAVCCAALIFGGCGNVSDPTDRVATPGSETPSRKPGEILPGEPTTPSTTVAMCKPDVDADTIAFRSESALVACEAPDGTNLSVAYWTPPPARPVSIVVASAARQDELPQASLLTSGLFGGKRLADVFVDGETATFRYRLTWQPDPQTADGRRVSTSYTDEIAVGDTVTHGPLTYTVLGITDSGDPATSRLDLAVTFDPTVPLE